MGHESSSARSDAGRSQGRTPPARSEVGQGGIQFFEWLAATVDRNDSLLCVGLDPQADRLGGEDVLAFNQRIIEATADLVCAYKPNYAFYEALGPGGLEALHKTITCVHEQGLPAILDAKRGDIGSTAQAYTEAAFRVWGADAITISPYLGGDSVVPFTQYAGKGVFVLCHTSNPSAQELQTLQIQGQRLYQKVAELAQSWDTDGTIGLVIGATYPQVLAEMRQRHPAMWFLMPGIGAQGGDLEAAVSAGLDARAQGLIVNVARGVIYADDPRGAALALRARINTVRRQHRSRDSSSRIQHHPHERLILALHDLGAIQFGAFTLKSGQPSPIYVDLRLLVSDPGIMQQAARAYARVMSSLTYDRIAAIPYGGLPIGQAVALETDRPLIYPRKEAKRYGTGRAIEGQYEAGETVVVLDDLITTGGSKFEAIAPLEAAGLHVRDVVVLIDREQGGAQELADAGYRLHPVLTLPTILEVLERHARIPAATRSEVEEFLDVARGSVAQS